MPRNDRHTRALALAAVTVLGAGLMLTPAVADPAPPSRADLDLARQAEARTSSRVAQVEVELAELEARREQLELAAQQANETYLQAEEDLAAAIVSATEARAHASAAAQEVELQRDELGRIAMRAYRSSPGALGPIEPLLSADSFEDAMRRATTVDRLGTRAEETLQRFQAVEQVAETFERQAQEAEAEQQAATEGVAAAAETARLAADSAATQVGLSVDRREALLTQLAEERGTTLALEQERQEALDAERRRRADQLAREAALAAVRDQETASRTVGRTVAAEEPSATPPAPAPPASAGPAPGPAPAREPAPAPSATTPSRPAPQPAPTQAPAPTQPPAPVPPVSAPSPAPAPEPPSSTAAARAALDWARTQLGKPYVWGAAGPNGYDCSGLTQAAFARAGVSIPRTTGAQYRATTRVPVDELQPGDLIFYSSNGAASGIYHVAFYAGNGMRLHAPSPGKTVELVPMYWSNVLPYGGRLP